MEKTAKRWNVRELTLIGMLTALICVTAPFSVVLPFTPVPISLGTLAVYFCAVVAGARRGTLSVLVYQLIGAVGVPVFVGWTAGLQKFVGPTGGYLLAYLLLAAVTGLFAERFEGSFAGCVVGMALATAALYLFGTVWLAALMKLSFGQALLMGVVPYLPGDAVKILVAALAGMPLRSRLKKAGLL